MKKKLIILGIFAALIITGGIISGVWDRTPFYEIVEEDGQHYLAMDPDWLDPLNQRNFSKTVPSWKSAKKAKKAITAGRISLDNLTALFGQKNFGSKNRIPILDPALICDLKLPEGLSVDEVYWYGDYYAVSFTGELGSGSVHVKIQAPTDEVFFLAEKTDLEKLKESWYGKHELVSQCREPDRDATASFYQKKDPYYRKYKHLEYTAGSGENTVYYAEHYILETEGPFTPSASCEVPVSVHFYGTSNGVQFSASMRPTIRPTMEQLAAFELVPME